MPVLTVHAGRKNGEPPKGNTPFFIPLYADQPARLNPPNAAAAKDLLRLLLRDGLLENLKVLQVEGSGHLPEHYLQRLFL